MKELAEEKRMGQLLDKDWFLRTDILQLSKELIGCTLRTNIGGVYTAGTIVETEAYYGVTDPACHAYLGRRTPRVQMLYAEGGLAYVYTCYGIHSLINVTTGPEGEANVILIRALIPEIGIDIMQARRGERVPVANLCKGPGALSQALGIDTRYNNTSLLHGDIAIEFGKTDGRILAGPRIGIANGKGDELPYRYFLADCKEVSSHRKTSPEL
jgi:DNA-3-methyladenine glycosylase